ncbi:DISARM system SNF2-like helicase DrmD [Butyrivibrio proteoclasticus]|uniref:DISARM system SNF2-like helicase DrmD n=1 Tax=Butyrivibrio proteoclasticus TaxID=43305 RepID=UPI000478E6D1|nr:DISARM system SNF2-like helicase DrmD [Butyrivibrio proteoclasticus]
MESNLLLEQYSRYKKISLEESPFKCLLNTDIELNPHQVNAFCAAIHALKTGGIVLADEVGLGKTIEAGLVLKYVIDSGAKKILIALPATLRKQWEIELDEKFGLKVDVLDRMTVEKDYYSMREYMENDGLRIILTSYDYASKFMKRFPFVKWDFIIVDEAHNLRNVFHGTKRAKNLYELTKGIPKILLTATPLQNSLSDLHGLISFIDPRIFGSEKVFSKRFIEGQDYSELKNELSPVLYRTLRKDVGKYMDFKKRKCITVDFHLTEEESNLYDLVNGFLKRDYLYSIPTANRSLIILVIRKLLASSSYALIETFLVLKDRLNKLYKGTKSSKAIEGFDLFWEFVEDEIDESGFEEDDDEEIAIKKQNIQAELEVVQAIIDTAHRIKTNAKVEALRTAIATALDYQEKEKIPQKVVVFTESKRTQKYIADELRKNGYKKNDIVLFNGDFDDPMTKEIYRAWQVKNYKKVNHGRSVEYKHAIVDYFKNNAKILIVTDAGSEGLNLQFCNTIINYDLPWNPQKIEQRIGRCHRYGQQHDVVAMNLLNTDNEADKRVYEILSRKFELFEGVFGASDIALGALESGVGFEKTILNIYQKCDSEKDFDREFDKLDQRLNADSNNQITQLRNILLTENPESKEEALEKTKSDITKYLDDVDFWSEINESQMSPAPSFWQIDGWGEDNFGSHGMLYIGAFCNNNEALFPVLLLCDENGDYIDFSESDIVSAIRGIQDTDLSRFVPKDKEMKYMSKVYDRLTHEMIDKYKRDVDPIMEYNRRKVENWVQLQKEQLIFQTMEMNADIEKLFLNESLARNSLEKKDIRKKIETKKKQIDKIQNSIPKKIEAFEKDASKTISSFNAQFDINPILLINVVLKF